MSYDFNTLEKHSRHTSYKPDPESHKLITSNHIESFNNLFKFQLSNGETSSLLKEIVNNLNPLYFYDNLGSSFSKNGNRLKIKLEKISVSSPGKTEILKKRIFQLPKDSRLERSSYLGTMTTDWTYQFNDQEPKKLSINSGSLPIMVKSSKCNLVDQLKLDPKKMAEKCEEKTELGGYFIINGLDKVFRLLITMKRNYVLAVNKPSNKNRGPDYTSHCTIIRSVSSDESFVTNTLHYLKDGSCTFKFYLNKFEYLIPVILIIKCLKQVTDLQVFKGLTMGNNDNVFVLTAVEKMLRSFKERYPMLNTQKECLSYLGQKFRAVMEFVDESDSDYEIGKQLIKGFILIHLDNFEDKYQIALHMVRKLYSFVQGSIADDNMDSIQNQELLLTGHIISNYIKELLRMYMNGLRYTVLSEKRKKKSSINFSGDSESESFFKYLMSKNRCEIGKRVETFLSTGNINKSIYFDSLMQVSGFCIMAEKINNARFLSHFRSVHRGSFFAEMKTTTVRKLLPESYGFMCPVHTPDGTPCGLLTHLAHQCKITTKNCHTKNIKSAVLKLGAIDINEDLSMDEQLLPIQLDGQVISWCKSDNIKNIAMQLRILKFHTLEDLRLPLELEIGCIEPSLKGQYPGIYMFSGPCRFSRPVKFLYNNELDIVGPFEQVYMDIACTEKNISERPNANYTHIDYAPTDMLSILANSTPFSDFNQSPRNMYQCQMAKQTIGVPTDLLKYRTDNKLYVIQSPQTPIVRNKIYEDYNLDDFPIGTNAVVAVISYTGYDMEDALVINKSSDERGFGYASIHKSEKICIEDYEEKSGKFKNKKEEYSIGIPENMQHILEYNEYLDIDGLPRIGSILTNGDIMCCVYKHPQNKLIYKKYKSSETAYIDEVILNGDESGKLTSVIIKYRTRRPIIIGDKFSSRHGQKGVCSNKWQTVDMPFSESGIQPDIIINPHAFPSRMTIGMFVESIAAKSGALHGISQDGTPFKFNENNTAVDYFGEQLKLAGYNYYGNEPMYSGLTGEEFHCDIYLGIVYYQRLRHMVADKYQVRSVGPVHPLTKQPVQGRKRHGGIRLGEMERDSLLAHGVSFFLQDRIMKCSDLTDILLCQLCGSILTTSFYSKNITLTPEKMKYSCSACEKSETNSETKIKKGKNKEICTLRIPYVLKYLAIELISMNIKVKIEADQLLQ